MSADIPERRNYLRRRLTNGEITLEEARELFRVMADDIAALRVALQAQRPQAEAQRAASVPSPRTQAQAENVLINVGMEEFMLMVGPMAGIFAAIMKRSMEGPNPKA